MSDAGVPMLRLEHITKTYPGSQAPAVDDLSLEIQEGEERVRITRAVAPAVHHVIANAPPSTFAVAPAVSTTAPVALVVPTRGKRPGGRAVALRARTRAGTVQSRLRLVCDPAR